MRRSVEPAEGDRERGEPIRGVRLPRPSAFDCAREEGFLDLLHHAHRRSDPSWWSWCYDRAWPFIRIERAFGPTADVHIDLLTIGPQRSFHPGEEAWVARAFSKYAIRSRPSIMIGATAAGVTVRREDAQACVREVILLFHETCGPRRWARPIAGCLSATYPSRPARPPTPQE